MDDPIYIALMDTTGIFAAILHSYLNYKYMHVVLSMDETLEEAYSFGRRNPSILFSRALRRRKRRKSLKPFQTRIIRFMRSGVPESRS